LKNIKPISDASDEELSAELVKHVRNDRLFSWLVVLALVLEAAVVWVYRRDKLEASLFILADLAIAAGVYGEIHSGRKEKMISGELDRRSELRVAEANARAAEANQKAEEARLEFAKYRQPRLLGPEQIERIAKAVSRFLATEFIASVSSPDPEIVEFLESIIAALEKASWIQLDASHPGVRRREDKPFIGTHAINRNVCVLVKSVHPVEEIPRMAQAGRALADALINEGFETTLLVWGEHAIGVVKLVNAQVQLVSSIIEVLIGPKA
jgi:hypothetical protein